MTLNKKAYKGTIDDMVGISQAKPQFDKAPHDFGAREALAGINYDHDEAASYAGISPEEISQETFLKIHALQNRMYETTVANIDEIMSDVIESHGEKTGGLINLLKGLNVPDVVKGSPYTAIAKKHAAIYEAETTIEMAQKGDPRAYAAMVKHLGDRHPDLKNAYASAAESRPDDLVKLYARYIVSSRQKDLEKEFVVEGENGETGFDARKYALYVRHVMQKLDKKKGGMQSAGVIAEVASKTAYK